MTITKDYKMMSFPRSFRPVDGVECPKKYSAYDQTSYDCIYCGESKLYKPCGYFGDRGACAGWETDKHGAVSCKGYVQDVEDRSKLL